MGEAKRRAAGGEMPRHAGGFHDRDADVRKLAAGMYQRVQQLVAENAGIGDNDLMNQMVAFLPGLHQIWTTTSNDTLANLCSEYPGFFRYAKVMEDAFTARRSNPSAPQFGPDVDPLPKQMRPVVAGVMSLGATLEREFQSSVDAFQRHADLGVQTNATAFQTDVARLGASAERHQQWVEGLADMFEATEAAGVSAASRQLLRTVFDEVNERLGKLSDRLMQVALAGRDAVRTGADQQTQ